MGFFSFLPKIIFVIITLNMVILTSISATFGIKSFMSDPKFIQMVKKENNIENYKTYFEYSQVPLKENEKKLGFYEYYETIYSLNYRRIPGPTTKINYDGYVSSLSDYYNVLTAAYSTTKKHTNEKLKNEMIVALSWQPDYSIGKFFDELKTYISNLPLCLYNSYNQGTVLKPSFVHCFTSIIDEHNCNWMDHDYVNNNNAEKTAKKLKKNLKETLSHTNKYEPFKACILSFRENIYPAYNSSKVPCRTFLPNLTLRQSYLLLSILYHLDYSFDHIDMVQLYYRHGGINQEINHKVLKADKTYCHNNKNALPERTYVSIVTLYSTLPNLSETETYDAFKKKKNETLETDTVNSGLYTLYKKTIETTSVEDYKNMLKRRALKNEIYYTYVMRMHLRGYLPLTESLWHEEIAMVHSNSAQKIIEKEFTDDLKTS